MSEVRVLHRPPLPPSLRRRVARRGRRTLTDMAETIRVMVEEGKKRVVASAFDWPGWVRSVKVGNDVLPVLEAYRPRYAPVAALAGLGDAFAAAGELEVVERLDGAGHGRLLRHLLGQDGRARVRADERGRVRAQDRPAAGVLGVLRRRRLAGVARAEEGAARRRTRSRPARPTCERRRDRRASQEGRRADTARGPRRPGGDPSPSRRLLRGGSASSTRAARPRAFEDQSSSRSGAPRTTCSITPGRWRTATCPEEPE